VEIKVADVEAYLKANPELSAEPDREDLQSAEAVVLHAVILGISATEIDFVHLGQRFSVGRGDVLDLSETQENVFNPFPRGKAAKLALKENATLRRQGTIKASQLQRNLPFPFVLSSSIPNRSSISPRELEWRARHGYHPAADRPTPQIGETDSPTMSQKGNDWQRDDFGYDDLISVTAPW
jgi:hypothetical protein